MPGDLINECPICGAEIQATVNLYLCNLTINEHGVILSAEQNDATAADFHRLDFDNERIYCREDHSLEDMLEAWHAPAPIDDDVADWLAVIS